MNHIDFYSNEKTDADRLLMMLEDHTNAADLACLEALENAAAALRFILNRDYDSAKWFAPDFATYRERIS